MMKQEPVSMTLVDLVALVAGVAAGFAVLKALPELPFIPPGWVLLVLAVSNFLQWATIACAVVALGRVASYRRMPRSAEWLAIVVSLFTVSRLQVFNFDLWVNVLLTMSPVGLDRIDFDGWRWLVATFASLLALVMLGLLRLARNVTPTWLKTLVLAWVYLLCLTGPLAVFGFLGDDLVSPSDGFGPGDLAILHRQLCILFGFFPIGLFFGVPALAVLIERMRRRHWSWSEWAAASSSILVGLTSMLFYRWEINRFSLGWIGERFLVLGWVIVVALVSRLILIRVGPAWNVWFGDISGQDRSTDSVSSNV